MIEISFDAYKVLVAANPDGLDFGGLTVVVPVPMSGDDGPPVRGPFRHVDFRGARPSESAINITVNVPGGFIGSERQLAERLGAELRRLRFIS